MAEVNKEKKTSKVVARYPRHSVERALRVPKAILDQNAGRPVTRKEAAAYVGSNPAGPFEVEIGSAVKYGFLERPEQGKIQPTELAKRILRPKNPEDEAKGFQEAVLQAPDISEVYKHYRGENIPDDTFFRNTLVDTVLGHHVLHRVGFCFNKNWTGEFSSRPQ